MLKWLVFLILWPQLETVFSIFWLEAELLFTSPGELLAALDEELELDELTDSLAILSTDSCKRRKIYYFAMLKMFLVTLLRLNLVGATAFSLLPSRGQQSPAFCRVWKQGANNKKSRRSSGTAGRSAATASVCGSHCLTPPPQSDRLTCLIKPSRFPLLPGRKIELLNRSSGLWRSHFESWCTQ